jgi:hypothetical protein
MILFALKIAEIMVNMAETRFTYREACSTRDPRVFVAFCIKEMNVECCHIVHASLAYQH